MITKINLVFVRYAMLDSAIDYKELIANLDPNKSIVGDAITNYVTVLEEAAKALATAKTVAIIDGFLVIEGEA